MVLLRQLAQHVDLFIVHSQNYGERMQQLLGFPRERWQVNPLSIETADYTDRARAVPTSERPPTVGYLARLAPEKGLHQLVDAFIELRKQIPNAQLLIAGWLGKQHEAYWQEQQDKLRTAGLAEAFKYLGSVDRQGKLDFLDSIDVLCVPTTYQEPKGLFVLESLAAGVPVVQPDHGAFPELIERLGGGYLVFSGRTECVGRTIEVGTERFAEGTRVGKLAGVRLCWNMPRPIRPPRDWLRCFIRFARASRHHATCARRKIICLGEPRYGWCLHRCDSQDAERSFCGSGD